MIETIISKLVVSIYSYEIRLYKIKNYKQFFFDADIIYVQIMVIS